MNYIDLANMTLAQGFKISGGYPRDHTGASVGSAGDINNDGLSDIFIGADCASPAGRDNAGIVYVIYGSASADIDLAKLSLARGFMIYGLADKDYTGYSVSSAGDVNNDGIDDLIVGASGADPVGRYDAGAAYVIYGSSTAGRYDSDTTYAIYGSSTSANIDLANLSLERGFMIYGSASGDLAGVSVKSAGDFNNDGIDDVVIGAFYADYADRTSAGMAYVIYGYATSANIDLANLTLAQGFKISGAASSNCAGSSVSSAGDVNNDGITDIIIGAFNASHADRISSGISYVIYGSNTITANIDLANFTLAQGFKVYGGAGDHVGRSVSNAGDVNNDGINDIIVGVIDASPAGRYRAGAAYIIYGSNTISADIDLTNLALTQGFSIYGSITHEYTGYSVSGAGDVNNDSINDIIVGALYASPAGRYRAGAAYVIYGNTTSANIDLANLPIERGFVISGGDTDNVAATVGSAGDVNHDGINDIIVGAYWADRASGTEAGAAYVVFGSSTPIFASTIISAAAQTESPTLSPTIALLQQPTELPTSAPITQPTMSTSTTAVIAKTLGVGVVLFGGIATISFLYNNNMCCFKSHTSSVDTVQANLEDMALIGIDLSGKDD